MLNIFYLVFVAILIVVLLYCFNWPTGNSSSFYNLTLWNIVELVADVTLVGVIGFFLQKRMQFSEKVVSTLLSDLDKIESLTMDLESLIYSYNSHGPQKYFREINLKLKNINQKSEALGKKIKLLEINVLTKRSESFLALKKEITGGSFGSGKVDELKAQRVINNYCTFLEEIRLSIFKKIRS